MAPDALMSHELCRCEELYDFPTSWLFQVFDDGEDKWSRERQSRDNPTHLTNFTTPERAT
jgi:hypothetical protein